MKKHPTRRTPAPPLRSTFTDEADMAEIIELFVAEMPARAEQIEASWRDRSFDDLKRLAHQLKGAAGGYGFEPVGAAAGRLEKTLRDATDRTAAVTFETIERETRELIELCRSVTL